MKGGLTIDEPEGPRWDLALDLVENGTEYVVLRNGVLISRETTSGPVHMAVIIASGDEPVIRANAQTTLDAARQLVDGIADDDERFASLLTRFGSVWELVADDGSGTIQLATVSDDGNVVWTVS